MKYGPCDWQKLYENISAAQQKYLEAISLMPDLTAKVQEAIGTSSTFDPVASVKTFATMMTTYIDPSHFVEQMQGMSTWLSAASAMSVPKMMDSAISTDKRFKNDEWSSNPFFYFIKQYYEGSGKFYEEFIGNFPVANKKEQHKVSFYTKQFLDAMFPGNLPFLNPDVIQETITSSGANILAGADNFIADVRRAAETGKFMIATTDFDSFTVGTNLACTPGKVVFQDELFQLIQYSPTTKEVNSIPILLVPAWINKYYILDLQEKNSFVRWLVAQGFTVFMVSWVNPGAEFASKTFEDYMISGVVTAMETVKELTKAPNINCVGYCLGGTMLASAMAYLAAKNKLNQYVNSATFLAALVDFTDVGDVGVFIDEQQLQALDAMMRQKGYLDGYYMALCFGILRSSDMIWRYYIDNYLLGKKPAAFDMLYWNADSTRMPYAMHSYYLRKLYLENALVKPSGLHLGGVGIDLRNINVPSYILATKEDHIAPWKSVYAATQLYKSKIRFVLGGSGHVAGIINHPEKNKYNYYTNDKNSHDPNEWLANAKESAGSWWLDWTKWLTNLNSATIPARVPDAKKAMENAPGSYVKVT